MVNLNDLDKSYKKVEDLKQNTYVLASKTLVDAVANGKWTDLTDGQKKIAAKNYTNKINEEAVKLAGGLIQEHNEFTPILLNPLGFTDEQNKSIAKDVSIAAPIYTTSMKDLTERLTMGVYNKIGDATSTTNLKNELAGKLDVLPGKIEGNEDLFKLWQYYYNKTKGLEVEKELLQKYR